METETSGKRDLEGSTSWFLQLWAMGLKATNRITPLIIYKMRKSIQLIVMLSLFTSFWSGFAFVLANYLFYCNEANGCKICSINIVEEGDCQPVSESYLDLSGGCVSARHFNNYNKINKAAMTQLDDLSAVFQEGLSPKFRQSFALHQTIWECFEGRQYLNRLHEPDHKCVKRFLDRTDTGIENVYYSGDDLRLSREDYTRFGIALMKSLHSLVTVLRSVDLHQRYLLFTNGSSIAGAFYTEDAVTGTEYQFFQTYTCILEIGGTKALMSTTLEKCTVRGPGSPILGIPSEYAVLKKEASEDRQFSEGFELRNFPGNRADALNASGLEDMLLVCPDTSIITTSTPTFEAGLYHCCITKNVIDMLGEGFGFASFTLTLGLLITTPLFFYSKMS